MEEKIGLVLGKFAPLHKGHQYLIETALSQVDKLYVLVYEAKQTTNVPLKTRCQWIKQIYPSVVVLSGDSAPETVGDSPEIMKLQDDYVRAMVPEKITHFFSSEWYGEHISKALGAENVIVDLKRITVPISATLVRNNPKSMREYVHSVVNASLVKKVVFLGAESTGKSTLAKKMAEIYKTEYVGEYGREYWEKNHSEDGKLTVKDLETIAKVHIRLEDIAVEKSNEILFVDTNAITTWVYSKYYDTMSDKLNTLAKACKDRYDMVFVCGTDIPYEQDGTRLSEKKQVAFQFELLEKLDELEINYGFVSGSLEERVSKVKEVIKNNWNIEE